MGLKPGQYFYALAIELPVGYQFEDKDVMMEVVRVLTEEEVRTEVPDFHLTMRIACPHDELYWAECRPLVH